MVVLVLAVLLLLVAVLLGVLLASTRRGLALLHATGLWHGEQLAVQRPACGAQRRMVRCMKLTSRELSEEKRSEAATHLHSHTCVHT